MKYTFTIEMNGREIVPGGISVQMHGEGDYMQASKEITALPYSTGLLVGLLTKKVLFDNEPQNDDNAEIMGEMFTEGFGQGLSDQVDAIDRNQAPATIESFKLKEK